MKRTASRPGDAPGDLIYLSDRKLTNLAVHFGVRTASFDSRVELGGSTELSAGVPSVASVATEATIRRGRTDPAVKERALARCLDDVVERLGGDELPNLEAVDDIWEAGWFRFHRQLRFGIGRSDSLESFRALVVVDEGGPPEGPPTAALLMTGATTHVRPPYAGEELKDAPGSRSGSGTGHLFQWLDATRRALEDDPSAKLDAVEAPLASTPHPPRDADTAFDMYRLFSRDGWLNEPQLPQLLHGAPCEGVAQASFIAVTENRTLVMGSPLFVRVRALPRDDADARPAKWRRPRFLRPSARR